MTNTASEFDNVLDEIKGRLNDGKSYTSDVELQRLVTRAINLLAAGTSIYADAGIDALAAILKPQGVTKKALHFEIKIARRSNPGLACVSVSGTLQNGMGVSVQSVTPGDTPDQESVTLCQDALEEQAATVLADDDPLDLVETQIRNLGYGGDLKAPKIVYLAATSRLLAIRPGAMPVHLLLHGPSSAGRATP